MKNYQEIFLAVIGITPQVLTECLYYYYSDYYKQNRPFDRIKIFTTLKGQETLCHKLFDEGKLNELEKELHLSDGEIPFSKSDIILFTDSNGEPIDDMRTSEENEESLIILHEELKRWTSEKEARVTATVAGGRKTMSTQMALAFQLYGREHDELIHIIPPDDKMDFRNPESKTWFFPKNPSDPTEKLDVSHVPVLKVGRYLSSSLDLPPGELIDKLQRDIVALSPIDELLVDGKNFISDEEKLKLSPLLSSYMRYFIKKRMSSSCDKNCSGCLECFVKNSDLPELIAGEILEDHKTLYDSNSGNYERTKAVRKSGKLLDLLEFVRSDISRLKTGIKESEISDRFKTSIQVKSLKLEEDNKQLKWHGVDLDPEIIRIIK